MRSSRRWWRKRAATAWSTVDGRSQSGNQDWRDEIAMVDGVFYFYAGAVDKHLGETIPVAGGVGLTFASRSGSSAERPLERPDRDLELEARPRARLREHRYDRFVELLVQATAEVRVGDPEDGATQIGLLISADQREKLASCADGNVVFRGNAPSNPRLLVPCTLVEAANADRFARLLRDPQHDLPEVLARLHALVGGARLGERED